MPNFPKFVQLLCVFERREPRSINCSLLSAFGATFRLVQLLCKTNPLLVMPPCDALTFGGVGGVLANPGRCDMGEGEPWLLLAMFGHTSITLYC